MTTATLTRPQERRTCAPCTLDAARVHRRAHVPDAVRAGLVRTSATEQHVAHEHAKIRRELARIHVDVAGMRDDLDQAIDAAEGEHATARLETSLYLVAALDPGLTERAALALAACALRHADNWGLDRPGEGVSLALAVLRGWTHRQALATGGAR